ncbi:unnamed protein product [Rhizophagus irregularis]|nr:unnamed protein product [Rhizophagus irregularis]
MTELNCKYLLGTCYTCQKCLYCFEFPQPEPCKCNKNKQPTRTKNPKRAQQIYQRIFKPDSLFPKANKFLFDANEKYGYNSNFEKSFSYTFCSTCNSKTQRYRSIDKKNHQAQIKENDNKVTPSDLSNEKEVENVDKKENHRIFSLVSSDSEKGEDVDDVEIDYEDSDLEEIKVQIIVKSNNIKVPTAKTLNIEPAVNARGPSNELEDESDFQEFISEYKRIILVGKKMSMIVTVRDNLTKKKKSRNKCSDESEVSSEELQYTKKKNHVPFVKKIYQKKREKDNWHLQLNPARLQLWAREIINKGATYEVPPSYPTFDAKSSVFVNKNNLTTQTQVSQTLPTTSTPIIIQLPSQLYPNSQEQLTSYSSNNTNSSIPLASPNTLPSIGEFFHSLDQKYNCNVYSNFENAFLEEEITVDVIKDLSDDQLQKLGVVKIGWQKSIKRAAQQF